MLRSLHRSLLSVCVVVTALASPSLAERIQGTVLERTGHTLAIHAKAGRTHVFRRAPGLRVGGEVDRWHQIRRGDSVKVRFHHGRGRAFAERIHVESRSAHVALHKAHDHERRVLGEITRVDRFALELRTRAGRSLRVRLAPSTLYFGTDRRRPLRVHDPVELIVDPRGRHRAPLALQVRRIGSAPESFARLDSPRRTQERDEGRRQDRNRRPR